MKMANSTLLLHQAEVLKLAKELLGPWYPIAGLTVWGDSQYQIQQDILVEVFSTSFALQTNHLFTKALHAQ
jgi:hypothetical protein